MVRPSFCRRVSGAPGAAAFKPAGVPARELIEIVMTLDEFEALRLADHEGLYHEVAAEQMQISRPTFGRILESARRKVAEALTLGRLLRIAGGVVHVEGESGSCPHRHRRGRGRCGQRGSASPGDADPGPDEPSDGGPSR